MIIIGERDNHNMRMMAKIIITLGLLMSFRTVLAGPYRQDNSPRNDSGMTLVTDSFEGTYDGQPHEAVVVSSPDDADISYSIDDGQTWTKEIPAITDAGKILFSAKAEKEGYETVYTEGSLVLSPLDVTVTIVGKNSSDVYDGKRHSVEGFDALFSSNLYSDDDFEFGGTASVSRIPVGKSEMGLTPDQFTNINRNFSVDFKVTDGYQEITAVEEVVVRITGHNNTVTFDGREHRVSGYDVEISNPLYKESFFDFLGVDEIRRTDVGTGYMGLSENDFVNISSKFSKVVFSVTDGYLEIDPGAEAALAILFTNEQLYGDEGAPDDVVPQALSLMAVLRNDEREYFSEPMSIDISYFKLEKPLPFRIMFKEGLPDLTTGKFSVRIDGLPEMVYGTGSPEGYDQSVRNKYYLTDESWIDSSGTIRVDLLWTHELNYDSEAEVHVLPEDSVGAYTIGPDGQKEYVVFETYEICMNYLGNADLCSSGHTFNK